MNTDIRRRILTLTLGAAVAVLSGPALHAQSSTAAPSPTTTAAPTTTTAASDNGQDMRQAVVKTDKVTDQYKRDTMNLKEQIRDNKAQLKSDMKTYGKASPQVAADKAQIQKDAQLRRGLQKNIRTDRVHTARLNQAARAHGHR